MMNLRVAAFGRLRTLVASYLALGGTGLVVLTGVAAIVEMVYHTQLQDTLGHTVEFLGATLDTRGVDAWFGAVFVLLTGLGLFEVARRRFVHDWGETQEWIEKEIKRREAL
jgi:branched-chain amino acid transport system permease protein